MTASVLQFPTTRRRAYSQPNEVWRIRRDAIAQGDVVCVHQARPKPEFTGSAQTLVVTVLLDALAKGSAKERRLLDRVVAGLHGAQNHYAPNDALDSLVNAVEKLRPPSA